jgi:hypothetical protein
MLINTIHVFIVSTLPTNLSIIRLNKKNPDCISTAKRDKKASEVIVRAQAARA